MKPPRQAGPASPLCAAAPYALRAGPQPTAPSPPAPAPRCHPVPPSPQGLQQSARELPHLAHAGRAILPSQILSYVAEPSAAAPQPAGVVRPPFRPPLPRRCRFRLFLPAGRIRRARPGPAGSACAVGHAASRCVRTNAQWPSLALHRGGPRSPSGAPVNRIQRLSYLRTPLRPQRTRKLAGSRRTHTASAHGCCGGLSPAILRTAVVCLRCRCVVFAPTRPLRSCRAAAVAPSLRAARLCGRDTEGVEASLLTCEPQADLLASRPAASHPSPPTNSDALQVSAGGPLLDSLSRTKGT